MTSGRFWIECSEELCKSAIKERVGDLSPTEIRTFERCRIGIVSGSDQRLAAVKDRRTRKVKCDNCPLSGFTLDRNVAEV